MGLSKERQRDRARKRERERERERLRDFLLRNGKMTLPWRERAWLPPHCPRQNSLLGPLEVLEDTEERSGHRLCFSGIIQGALLDVHTELQCMRAMGKQVRTELLLGPPTWWMKKMQSRVVGK